MRPNNLTDDARLFFEVAVDGNRVQKTELLTHESAVSPWRLNEAIELSDSVPYCRFIVTMECADRECQQLGFTDVASAELLGRCAEENHEFARELIRINDGPALELGCFCSVIPLETPEDDSGIFYDSAEEEAFRNELQLLRLSGRPIEPDQAIHMFLDIKLDMALQLSDKDEEKPLRLKSIGDLFYKRHSTLYENTDLDKAIAMYEAASRLMPYGHQCLAELLSQFGLSLFKRIEYFGKVADIDNAIFAFERSLMLTPDGHSDKPNYLNNLGCSFSCRFERGGDLADNDRAISAHEQAVNLTPDGHADKPGRLNNLGNAFAHHFRRYGDLADSDRAISAHKQAVNLTPDSHADKPGHLNNLGSSFSLRFERCGDLADIDRAISAHEQVVNLIPDGHADKSGYLTNLGNSLLYRFEHSMDLGDIDRAISAYEQAMNLTPDDHADKSGRLSNLGNSFVRHFQCSEDLADSDRAISVHEQAVNLTPDYLNSPGTSFSYRFEHSGDLSDSDKAISTHEQAVNLTPNGHADKPGYLNNLGNSFLCRFEHSGDLADSDRAISAHEQAVKLTLGGHADEPGYLQNLGNSFSCRFECSGDLADSDRAISYYCSASNCHTGPAPLRFRAALKWARLASRVGRPSALEGYARALDLLPQAVWLGRSITARHRELLSIGAVGSEAAAAASAAEQYETALEWLEQGRSIVWNQLLSLRTPVDALRDVDPILADALERVSMALEHASTGELSTHDPSEQSGRRLSTEEAAQRHRRLAEEWERLVGRVRDIAGFEDFLRPKRFTQLHIAAKAGPVTVVNVHESRCDAFVLMDGLDEVVHIPLHYFSYVKAQQLHLHLNQLLSAASVRVRDIDIRAMKLATPTGGGGFEFILSNLWSSVAQPVLDSLAFPVSCAQNPPRMWWCATGPLAFLPIHAAGTYDESAPGFNISDYVVSSYAPTLTAIIDAHKSHDARHKYRGFLAISQWGTPGQSALPNTEVELDLIKEQASKFGVCLLRGPDATMESVIEGMEVYSWVHFACHGTQVINKPTESALCLYDKCLELSTIITKSLPHAEFAFLSACQTATGDEKLSEEAVHLAAGLMLAGYSSVVATMWSIKDRDAPVIAGHVYTELFRDGELDSTRAAVALHHAVKLLRQQVGDSAFVSWVPFIHIGV